MNDVELELHELTASRDSTYKRAGVTFRWSRELVSVLVRIMNAVNHLRDDVNQLRQEIDELRNQSISPRGQKPEKGAKPNHPLFSQSSGAC